MADQECSNLARNAGVSGSYKAWFSEASSSVISRFSQSSGPYVNMSNQTLATNWADLTDGNLQQPIRFTEQINDISGSATPLYATGSQIDGSFSGFACSNQSVVTTGFSGSTSASWTNLRVDSCNVALRLLCVEQ